MNRAGPIGVFDSGVGGLSLLRHVRAALPDEPLIYLADTRYVPYGDRGEAFVRRRSAEVVAWLQGRGAKAVVVACNTATAAAVDHLRARFALPIIAMEPAVKPAAALTRSDVVAVLATAGTLGSERYAALKDRHGRDVRVIERACRQWVDLVERGELAGAGVEAVVRSDLEPLLGAGADVLVLGCTHFPFLDPVIRQVVAGRAEIIDPAPAVARQLIRRLRENRLCRDSSPGFERATTECLYTGAEPPRIERLWDHAACGAFTAIDL